MIEESLLRTYGASEKQLSKDEVLFSEGQKAMYFYQVSDGEVKMNNYNSEGREFIQGIFRNGQSFGEPPLFGGFTYPANAVAVAPTRLMRLERSRFFQLLKENPDAHLHVTEELGKRLHYKAVIASEISQNNPEHRIVKLLEYFKFNIHKIPEEIPYKVELTRQQIGDLTGLRVETTIRTIKKLAEQGKLKIVSRKVWL